MPEQTERQRGDSHNFGYLNDHTQSINSYAIFFFNKWKINFKYLQGIGTMK